MAGTLIAVASSYAYGISPFRGVPEESKFEQMQLLLSTPEKHSAPLFATPASDLTNKFYAQWDALNTGLKRQGYDAMPKLTIDDKGNAILQDFGNETCALKGTYDAATSTLTIPAQTAFEESPYGTFTFCYFDSQRMGFIPNQGVTFTVQSDGTLKANGGWCYIVADRESTYYGVATAVSLSCTLTAANAQMSGEIAQSDGSFMNGSYPLYVLQTAADELMVANFTGNGTEVRITMTPQKQVTIEPQMILYNALTGPYCIFATNWSASKPSGSGNVTGEILDNTMIEFGQWGVFRNNSKTITTGGMKSSMLTMDSGKTFSIPQTSTITFSGSGTEADPYKINSATDIYNLAIAVNSGNKYSGKYFLLTADIDYTSELSYRPIGTNATNYFDGIFDGGGHTISNVSIQRGAADYTGLFGYAGANSSIRNLNVKTGYILTFGKYTGFIAGYTLGSISYCTVSGNINTIADYVGGIVGSGRGVSQCEFTGNISTTAAQAGGIAGQLSYDAIKDCRVRASITSSVASSSISHAVGGVVGQLTANATTASSVERCSFVGTAYDKTGYAHLGGIAGSLARYTTITQCASMGMLSTVVKSASTGSCGGVVGYCSEGIVENCYAGNLITGSVVSNKTGGICGIICKLTSGSGTARHNIFTGQVSIAGALTPTASIYGKIEAGCTAEDNWFDSQIGGEAPSENGLITSSLTSGQLPGNLEAAAWSANKGLYPYPASAPEELRPLATVPLELAAGNTSKSVKTSFTLGSAQGVDWSIYDGTNYVTESSALKITGSTVELKGVMETAFMVARTSLGDNSFLKLITLQLAPPQFEGAGTEDNPYLIKSIADLRTINNSIIKFDQTFEGDYFKMANDIDMTGVDTTFLGIAEYGKATAMFNGTFDGNGKAIKNWKVQGLFTDDQGKADTKTSIATIALFSQIGSKGVVKNVNIDASCSLTGYAGIAGIAAVSYGTIENCRNFADITIANNYTGGIAARMMEGAKTINCYNAGTITTGYGYAGGIVADIKENTLVKGCLNAGLVQTKQVTASYPITDTRYAAGIVAVNATGAIISNCLNAGEIIGNQYTGGISAGFASGASMEGCVNTGPVKNTSTFGGAMIGQPLASTGLQNNYYDKQILILGAANGNEVEGINGSFTSLLTSGNPLPGLDPSIWQYNAGMYPTIKAFAAENAADAYRKMVVTLRDGETVKEMTSPATLAAFQGLTWSIPQNITTFKIENGKLTIGDISAPTSVALTSTYGAYSRTIDIQGINNPFAGEGTEANPYKIASVADMNTLSKYTSEYAVRYENKYFAMTADIDMQPATNFNLISWGGTAEFRGTFDGQNHTLANLSIERTASTDNYIGLFGVIGVGGTVKNLKIGSGKVNGYRYVGAISGNCKGTISNCENHAEVNTVGGTMTNNYAGGLTGYMEKGATITHSDNYGKVYSSYTYSGGIAGYATSGTSITYCNNYGSVATDETRNYAGGIVGGGNMNLDSCVNYGQISANAYAGGIGGSLGAGDLPVTNCVNRGIIAAKTSYVGGIAGTAAAELRNCANYTDIEATGYLGGIAGSLSKAAYDCVNYGSIKGTKSNYVGGVAGYASGSLIVRCTNRGDSVTSVGNTVGGIVGTTSSNSASVDSCVNYAHVVASGTSAYQVGGIAGSCSSKINDCINYGSVKSDNYSTAGIAGGGSGSAYRNINVGNVTSTFAATTAKGNAAGIWGDSGGTISDCINYGNVTANRYCAGIAGRPGSSTKVLNCYFSGTLTTGDANTSGAIVNKESTMTNITVTNCYYNSDVNTDIKQSTLAAAVATPLTTVEMCSAKLGEAYDYHKAAMPTLKVHADEAGTNACAAILLFAADESATNFKTEAIIPMLPGLVWSATDNVKVGDGIIYNRAKQKNETATVYVKGGVVERSFTLLIPEVSGIDNNFNGKSITRTMLFNMQGVAIQTPADGEMLIEIIEYTDGTMERRKAIYRK